MGSWRRVDMILDTLLIFPPHFSHHCIFPQHFPTISFLLHNRPTATNWMLDPCEGPSCSPAHSCLPTSITPTSTGPTMSSPSLMRECSGLVTFTCLIQTMMKPLTLTCHPTGYSGDLFKLGSIDIYWVEGLIVINKIVIQILSTYSLQIILLCVNCN